MEHTGNNYHKEPQPITPTRKIAQFDIKLTCNDCASYVEKLIMELEGVEFASCDKLSHSILIQYDPVKTGLGNIEQAISAAGYDTPTFKRKVEFYTEAPKCCRSREGLPSDPYPLH